jgi:hypothetical protein
MAKKKKNDTWSAWDNKYNKIQEEEDDFNVDDVFSEVVSERELINPKLSRWDKVDLHELLVKDLHEFVQKTKVAPFATMDSVQFEEEMDKIFPKYLFYDTYNVNYTPTEAMKMGKIDENNKWLFDFLMNNATDYYFKAVTQSSTFNSYVLTSEIAKQLLLLHQQQNPEQPEDGEGDGDGDGEGDGNGGGGIKKTLQDMQNSGKGQKQLQEMMDKARQEAENRIEKAEESGEQGGGLDASKDLGSLGFGEIQEFLDYNDAVKHISLKSELINNFVRTTLNLSKTYFSSKYKEFEQELLEADEIDDLVGIENLHPALKRVHLDDIVTHERKYQMKFDVYIDISGSMSSNIYGYNRQQRENISGLDMAKITALKLKQYGYVEDVYPFESQVHKVLKTPLEIATMKTCGGTDIDAVIQHIEKTGRPSVIITDMQDNISLFNDNAYFIGILGAHFEGFKNTEVGKNYIDRRQCVKYNNDNTFAIVS